VELKTKTKKNCGHGKVEIQDQDFPLSTAQNACGARKKRPFTQNHLTHLGGSGGPTISFSTRPQSLERLVH